MKKIFLSLLSLTFSVLSGAATGEFSNIVNNPIWQTIKIPTAKVRVLRFEADRLAEGKRLGYSDLDIY